MNVVCHQDLTIPARGMRIRRDCPLLLALHVWQLLGYPSTSNHRYDPTTSCDSGAEEGVNVNSLNGQSVLNSARVDP